MYNGLWYCCAEVKLCRSKCITVYNCFVCLCVRQYIFKTVILKNVASSPNFVLVISPNASSTVTNTCGSRITPLPLDACENLPAELVQKTPTTRSRNASRDRQRRFSVNADDEELEKLFADIEEVRSLLATDENAPNNFYLLSVLVRSFMCNRKIETSSKLSRVAEDRLIVTTENAVLELLAATTAHNRMCPSQSFAISKRIDHSFSCELTFACNQRHRNMHNIQWSSSPYFADDYFVNYKICFTAHAAGLSRTELAVFAECSGMGRLSHNLYDGKFLPLLEIATRQAAEDSMSVGLQEEISLSEPNGIRICTDARHGQRRNSKRSNIPCMGLRTGKCIEHEIVCIARASCSAP